MFSGTGTLCGQTFDQSRMVISGLDTSTFSDRPPEKVVMPVVVHDSRHMEFYMSSYIMANRWILLGWELIWKQIGLPLQRQSLL